jgi:type IV secretion system protein VirD4
MFIMPFIVWDFLRPKRRTDTHGSASFGSARAFEGSVGDLIIGRSHRGKLLRYEGAAHLLTIAPTRSGKGVGTIIPNLLTLQRSIICIDPKGENARVAGRARSRHGPVYCLDPFGVSGHPSARYNPLDFLSADSTDLTEDAMTLAEALVFDGGPVTDTHWNEEAKALIAGLILYTVCHDPAERRTLTQVRQYLTLAPEHWHELLLLMQESQAAGGLVARAANRYAGKSDREASGVLSSAQRHTHFLDSPRIAAALSGSDFSFSDVKEGLASVFLCLPPERLDTYSRWLRLLLSQALIDMARSPAKPSHPVLFLLDEFAALGRLEPVERAMGLMAGYGLQLWPILQDIHQLRALYGPRAGTFLSNAGVVQAFGVNDYETADLISKAFGDTTIEFETSGRSESRQGLFGTRTKSRSTSSHVTGRRLMNPDEIMRLSGDDLVLMIQGKKPLIAQKVRYFEEAEFKGLADAA